ncbi:cob(I)yrinic acid a,c-diamide adenosyltransferase [Phormidium yuhuli AB48]|uniref:Cob(I)yrinic acid a,c-diamide adenosyltransferase n=1 Tax=Phormidium yuhuli AB48 TaxID=2940671 RepID=A0ABY5AQG3_9CYAN|nr:cob(I)yrinic acid a,c-diamide adenosyltransferase [Phormidium yuhuli]USR91455.1 cob(I)yrinic acid a,c-diamide adenosyltransferase [Phormidium yuhuli AB48]
MTTHSQTDALSAKEQERLRKIKAAKDKSHEARQGQEKGLYVLFTGLGKGKTSSAMNLVYRHLAHDLPCAVVQFVKNSEAYPDGDRLLLTKLSQQGFPVRIHTLGGGFTWETQNPEQDRQMAAAAWEQALEYIQDPEISLVVLDELHIALKNKQLQVETVLAGIQSRPVLCHVATTGRYAPQELIEAADLVTEMTRVKHPISQGIPAQLGIEF